MHSNLASHPNHCRSRREKIAKPWPLPDAAALSSMHGLPRSDNSSAQTSASLHPPAALRLRVLPFTRTWSSTVCAEEFPTPLEMSLHGLPLLRYSKSIGPSAPIVYTTYVSPPGEAAAWPGCRCWMLDMAVDWPGAAFLQITARANPCSRHLWGTLARAVASICAHRAR